MDYRYQAFKMSHAYHFFQCLLTVFPFSRLFQHTPIVADVFLRAINRVLLLSLLLLYSYCHYYYCYAFYIYHIYIQIYIYIYLIYLYLYIYIYIYLYIYIYCIYIYIYIYTIVSKSHIQSAQWIEPNII